MSLCWSKSRYRLFSECRRQYFLHYIVADEGWDMAAPEETQEIYFLKQLTQPEWYAFRLARLVLYRLINQRISTDEPFTTQFRRELWRQWSIDISTNQCHFLPVYYGEITQQTALNLVEITLKSIIKQFKYSTLADTLNHRYRTHAIELPLDFQMGGVKVYATPFALFSTEYGYNFIHLSGRDNRIDAVVMYFYLLQAGLAEPMEVMTSFYDIFSGDMSNISYDEINFSVAIEQISFESAAMAEIPEDIVTAKAFFAIPENKKHCPKCRFRAVCQKHII